MTPRPDTEFSAWEARVGLPDAAATAKVLGITRPAVYQLRAGRWRPHSSTKQLMRLIEANPRLVRQLMALSEADP